MKKFKLGETLYFTYDDKNVSQGILEEIRSSVITDGDQVTDNKVRYKYVLRYPNKHTECFNENVLYRSKNEVLIDIINQLKRKLDQS